MVFKLYDLNYNKGRYNQIICLKIVFVVKIKF